MTLSHEIQAPIETSATIAQAFDSARKQIVGMTSDAEFHEACLGQIPSVDPYDDMDKLVYWETFGIYATDELAKYRDDTRPDPTLDAMVLLAETPCYLFYKAKSEDNNFTSREERRHAKQLFSYYNSLIRGFAYNHPEANVSDVKAGLVAMANISMEDKDIRQAAVREAYITIHGAQHEMAFGQVLAYTGYDYWPADGEADLKGIDWIVQTDPATTLGIDVKASTRLLTIEPGNTVDFKLVSAHKVIMHSGASEAEFGDRFFISEQSAASKSVNLTATIERANHAAA